MKTIIIIPLIIFYFHIQSLGQVSTIKEPNKIQLALLLDVSGSMDALVFKVKSQFWKIVNYLNTAKKGNKKVVIEYALITYGGDTLSEYHIDVKSDLTTDLDLLSDKLYKIQVNGSNEFCWQTLDKALNDLSWSENKGDLRLIFIAGNESFNQGEPNPKLIIKKAKKSDIVINTIYCNTTKIKQDSISVEWKEVADLSKGNYFSITLDDSTSTDEEHILDEKLIKYNEKLNKTYIPYGQEGKEKYERMLRQDRNVKLLGMSFFRDRVFYKVQPDFKNETWDLLDAFINDKTILEKLGNRELPSELQNLSSEDMKKYIEQQLYLRASYQEFIELRYARIIKYVGKPKESTLDTMIKKIVAKEGKKKKFVFGE